MNRNSLPIWLLLLVLPLCGCTTLSQYVDNRFKVGPAYHEPAPAVAEKWIDAGDKRVHNTSEDLTMWWKVFRDPILDQLIEDARRENLTLRQAAYRIIQARANLGIAVGNLFPQTQAITAGYERSAISLQNANSVFKTPIGTFGLQQYYSQWNLGFNLGWEIDLWGRIRRAVEANAAVLDASVADYDDVLVTLLGDVADAYVQMRTSEQQIEYAKENLGAQVDTLKIVEARFKAGTITGLDLRQSRSIVAQTRAQIPEFEIQQRLAENQLCILMGIPPESLRTRLGQKAIPTAPPEVAVGVPAELLRRRPDIRRAERQCAAQSARIGVAEAEFYPIFSINGTIGYSASAIPGMFQPSGLTGSTYPALLPAPGIGPAVQWNILNYGRLLNNVRYQDAKFQETVAFYRNAVIKANQEVENGLVTFLRAQQRTAFQAECVTETDEALKLARAQYEKGTIDFTRVDQILETKAQQQDTLAQARGEIAHGLIQVYRALGGGWEIRLRECPATLMAPVSE